MSTFRVVISGIALSGLLLVSRSVFSDSSTGDSRNGGNHRAERQHSSRTDSKLSQDEKLHASQWGLSKDEYQRFKTILKSPRAYFTPGLKHNPLLALALESESDAEKSRLADRWVNIQFENNRKIIAWQLEVTAAWQRQFPNVPSFSYNNPATAHHRVSQSSASVFPTWMKGKAQSAKRAQLYVKTNDCPTCTTMFQQLFKQVAQGSLSGIDVHFVGKPGKDEIISWATRAGLTTNDVNRKRTVTLNLSDKNDLDTPYVE